MRWNFVKTHSLGQRKTSSKKPWTFVKVMDKVCPFFMAWMKETLLTLKIWDFMKVIDISQIEQNLMP